MLATGDGEPVVLLPSASRGAADFARLQDLLADAGYRSLAVNPPGVGASTRQPDGASFRDSADQLAAVVERLASGRAHFVGHAAGNIVARGTASHRPEVVATVAVVPCGGHNLDAYPVAPEVLAAFPRCHDESLPAADRIAAMQVAFFAPGNDPSPWLEGWWPGSGFASGLSADPEEWWAAGTAPILIMHPRDDAMSPIASGRASMAAFGERATYVEIPDCGHAVLPEQPELIAANLVAFLRAHPIAG